MNKTLAMMFVALILASAAALRAESPKETKGMPNDKVIMLIEAKIKPEQRTGLIEAARQYLPLVRAEAGVEAFYLTAKQDEPNTFVFYEIYKSKTAQDFHLAQPFTKKFLETLKNAQAGDRVRTNLIELAETSTPPN